MVWYTNQSLPLIALSFLLGLLVGYLWWGLRLRRVRNAESITESDPRAVAPASESAAAAPVALAATASPASTEVEPVADEPEPAEIEPAYASAAEPEPAAETESAFAASAAPAVVEPAVVEPVVVAEPEPVVVAEPESELASFGAEAAPTTVDTASEALVADVESAFAGLPEDTTAPQPEDLARIEGIGPKIAAALQAAGITTFAQLADADRSAVEDALTDANLRFAPSLGTWAQQARLLADGDEEGFKALTDRLIAGREVTAKPAAAEPVAVEPVAAEPVAVEPVAVEPVAVEPVAVEPVAVEPVAVEPEPVAVEPEPVVEPEPLFVEPVAEESFAAEPEPVAGEPVAEETVAAEAVVVPAQALAVEDGPADDLKRIEGIGPKMSAALIAGGIRTFGQLAATDVETLRTTIETAGLRFAPSIVTWARQARLLADGDEAGFADLTRRLVAGRDTGRA